ncbi:MAG: ATP synthase F0 subunit C [Candidatus Aminicenantes bacterium]|nr:ATP synthase F0 subunit C [Candidatus Aminicenantes bacterium]
MNQKMKAFGAFLFILIVMSAPLLAQDDVSNNKTSLFKWAMLIGGSIIALAAAAGAYCQAKAISSACEGISRNPGSAPHIRFLLIFGLVLIETLVIYTLLISIIILMVQWGKY